MLTTAIIVALIFLVVAIIAIGKMYDAQKELEFVKAAYEDKLDDIQDIIDSEYEDSRKLQDIERLI